MICVENIHIVLPAKNIRICPYISFQTWLARQHQLQRDKENDLMQTKLHGAARLLEEGIGHRVVEITHLLIEMS